MTLALEIRSPEPYRVISTAPSATEKLTESFFQSLTANTQEAYRRDLQHFTVWMKAESICDAALILWGQGHAAANKRALDWRTHLVTQGLAPATINRRLSALRSLCEFGETVGYISWRLKVKPVKSKSYRDTAGPGYEKCVAMLNHIKSRQDFKGRRDAAILALLVDWGLRRSEIVSLNLDDLNLDAEPVTLSIIGKGRTEPEMITLTVETVEDIEAYLQVRGGDPGPLFISYPGRIEKRLTPHSLYDIVKAAGVAVGIKKPVSPHGFRHSVITKILDEGASIREAQSFSRHADIRVLIRYDDNRRDGGGKVAARLASKMRSVSNDDTCKTNL